MLHMVKVSEVELFREVRCNGQFGYGGGLCVTFADSMVTGN